MTDIPLTWKEAEESVIKTQYATDEEVIAEAKRLVDKKLADMRMGSENPEMRLCKYSLTLEAYVWSIITCPFVALDYVFKYINWCLVASLFRLLWLPVVAGSMWWTSSFSTEWCKSHSEICAAIVILWFFGSIVGLASWMALLSDRYGKEHEYIKSKWLWK
jgi:hypothetical protein